MRKRTGGKLGEQLEALMLLPLARSAAGSDAACAAWELATAATASPELRRCLRAARGVKDLDAVRGSSRGARG